MKTKLALSLILIALLNTIQFAGWELKSSYFWKVSDVYFVNENTGFLVTGLSSSGNAQSGLILKTSNG